VTSGLSAMAPRVRSRISEENGIRNTECSALESSCPSVWKITMCSVDQNTDANVPHRVTSLARQHARAEEADEGAADHRLGGFGWDLIEAEASPSSSTSTASLEVGAAQGMQSTALTAVAPAATIGSPAGSRRLWLP
jgi:hypothetical protein